MSLFRTLSLVAVCAALLAGCLQPQRVVPILNAENIRKSVDGRIFIAGSDGVHQLIQGTNGQFEAPIVIDEGCTYYGGLAELNGWLFSVCVDVNLVFENGQLSLAGGRLLAYSLADARIVTVATLDDFALPNGLDALKDANAILIADEDFTGHGGVARANLDFSGAVPVLTSMQTRWIGESLGVTAANGVRVFRGDVYLTDIDTVKRVALDAGAPQQSEVMYRTPTASVLDDLAPYCDGLLVADFLRTRLVYMPLSEEGVVGEPLESAPPFAGPPSAVLPDATPLFDQGQILVTLVSGEVAWVTEQSLGLPGCL